MAHVGGTTRTTSNLYFTYIHCHDVCVPRFESYLTTGMKLAPSKEEQQVSLEHQQHQREATTMR